VNDAHPRWQHAEGQDGYPQDPNPQDPYAQQSNDYGYGYDPEGRPEYQQQYQRDYRQQEGYAEQYPGRIPQQYERYQEPQETQQQPYYQQSVPAPEPAIDSEAASGSEPGAETAGAAREYDTEQFAFVDEADEESDDVIDWLKFSESRTERRDERKRRGRNRVITLVVVVVLVLSAGIGYLWQAGLIPGFGKAGTVSATSGNRDVILLNLRPVNSAETSSALLVSNSATHKGYMVLLPNSLSVNTDSGGSTTLGKSVAAGASTRDALNTLLGANINGTWRLDTPYLQLLVQALGNITVDTDVTVKSGTGSSATTLVTAGKQQSLTGQAAVAYATYRAPGEAEVKQLARFGQVIEAVLKKMSSNAGLATKTIQSLNAIPDPSLSDQALGAGLAVLAQEAKTGSYSTTPLPVQSDGTLGATATSSVVRDILGGAVNSAASSATPSVSVRNASGDQTKAGAAQVAMINAGYTYISGGSAGTTQAASQITYADAAQKQNAIEVAKTLGLSTSLVKQGPGAANAEITVVLGQDYQPSTG
jgi:anionic cell wall polymer biosynthesis LytR-Cps2A-Psr (LCP) family protein